MPSYFIFHVTLAKWYSVDECDASLCHLLEPNLNGGV